MAPSRDPATIVRPKAVADAIVIIQRPGFAADASVAAYHKKMNFDPLSESQWASDIKAGPQVTSIIGFAGEYKSRLSTSTHHQLIMDLTTAQCQRKAIGLPNATLYGVTVHQGEFSIYASWWMPDRIAFGQSRNGRTFNLNDPIDLLRCFFFLRMLRPRIIGNMGDEFANLSPSAAVQSLATFRWRMEDRRKHPSKWLHSGNESEHRKKRRSAQQESMNEVPSLCEDEDEIEDFTRQELDAWSDTRDTYRQEAATLLSELGATIHCVAVYRIVSHMQLCSIRDDHLIS
ncbi:hypothetical protein K439DRAFT_1106264 [Ramaria rubella]|nr:hypothetical protein K439DRAFT_1106264 [Ramaria rubella]